MPFVPIELEDFVRMHVKGNSNEDAKDLRARLRSAAAARKAGETCHCGNPIWVTGSAFTGHGCFTCITLEAVPDNDYELASVLEGEGK